MPTIQELLKAQGVETPEGAASSSPPAPSNIQDLLGSAGIERPEPSEIEKRFGPKPGDSEKARAFSSSAGRVVVESFEGAVQHATNWLSKLGLVNENTAQAVEKFRNDDRERFLEINRDAQDKHPIYSMAGQATGNIALYTAMGESFGATKLAQGIIKYAPVIGRMLGAAASGAVVEGAQTEKTEDVGEQAFKGALGALVGERIGAGVGYGAAKIANAVQASRMVKILSKAADGWNEDNAKLATAFQSTLKATRQKQLDLGGEADRLMQLDIQNNGGKIPSSWSTKTDKAIKAAEDFKEDNKFLESGIFSKTARAEGVGGGRGATTWLEANRSLINAVTGDDVTKAAKVYNAFSAGNRDLIRKGIFYDALEKATTNGRYDLEKLKEALSTPGTQFWLQGNRWDKVAKGLVTIIGTGQDIVGHHPYLVAHGVSEMVGAGAAAAGFRHGGAATAASGFIGYVASIAMVNKLLGSQAGMNLLASAGGLRPGSPAAVRHFAAAARMIGLGIGAETAVNAKLPSLTPGNEP